MLTSLSRARLFAGAGLVASVNALAPRISWSWSKGPWVSVSETFGVSAIIWLALLAIVALALGHACEASDDSDPLASAAEKAIAAAAVILSLLPAAAVSAAVLVPLSLWMFLSSRQGERTRRIGLILLSLSLTLFWGPFLLRVMPELLEADAHLVAWVLSGEAKGNIFASADGSSHFLIAPGCSSLNNISLATILMVTGAQYFGTALDRRAFWTVLVASAVTVAVNIARMATIALRPGELDYWHHGAGATLFGWIALAGIAVVVGRSLDRTMMHARR